MKSTTERRWLEILNKWRTSGLDVREFCKTEKLSYRTFTANRRRLREKLQNPEDAEFVELTNPVPPEHAIAAATIRLGKLTLALEHISAVDLCAILKTLEFRSCSR